MNDIGFRKLFPMENESETPQSIQSFITLVGLPPAIHADNAKVFVQGNFRRKRKKYDIWATAIEKEMTSIKEFGTFDILDNDRTGHSTSSIMIEGYHNMPYDLRY